MECTFLNWRSPQQMLRTHCSLKAYCASLWWRWWSFFLVFHFNGAPVEGNWQGKPEVLGEIPVPVPLCPPQIPHGRTRDRKRASAVRGRRLTAWATCNVLTLRRWKGKGKCEVARMHTVKTYVGVNVQLHTLPSALKGVSSQFQAQVTLLFEEREPSTHYIGGWVGPTATWKKCSPCWS